MISIEGITKYYDSTCAVDNISFRVNRGEILGLLGPNGAGKTTTLRIMTCYMKPTSGTVRVKDLNIHDHAVEIKKIMGYLPESAPLYHDMLVYDYLHFVADIRGIVKDAKRERIHHLADICGLKDVMHRPVNELSKGYRQRVGLAHAMMGDPEILVLDEPTSGLDPNQIIEIRDIIRKIGKEKTVILSTHILSEAEATCDRVVIINRGRIVADDSTESLKKSAGDSYSIHLLLGDADTESVKEVLSGLSDEIHSVSAVSEDGFIKVSLSCGRGRDVRGDIYRAIKGRDWTLLEFYRETRTLESIFRELTKEN
jgi:ABC-2 type transport system ATP-binding protein